MKTPSEVMEDKREQYPRILITTALMPNVDATQIRVGVQFQVIRLIDGMTMTRTTADELSIIVSDTIDKMVMELAERLYDKAQELAAQRAEGYKK